MIVGDCIRWKLVEADRFEALTSRQLLRGLAGALAATSGMAAQFIALATLLGPRAQIVGSAALSGGTSMQFDITLCRWGGDVIFVAPAAPANVRRGLTPRTRVLSGETIGHPPPGETAPPHPAVPAQPLARLDPATGDPG